jgi:hypothetical protein
MIHLSIYPFVDYLLFIIQAIFVAMCDYQRVASMELRSRSAALWQVSSQSSPWYRGGFTPKLPWKL